MQHRGPGPSLPATAPRRPSMSGATRRGFLISAALILGLPALAGLGIWATSPPPVVTTVVRADGTEERLRWREHPGHAGWDAAEASTAPPLEDAIATQESMVGLITEQLHARFGMSWAVGPDPAQRQSITFETENGWGGPSMLRGVNLPTWQSDAVPGTWTAKQEAMGIISEVLTAHGWSEPYLDQERWPEDPEDLIEMYGGAGPQDQVLVTGGAEGPGSQWLSFAFQDMSRDDPDGTFAKRNEGAAAYGWEQDSITISFGASGLLPAGDRAEYERRVAPFAGLPQPAALEDQLHSPPPAKLSSVARTG
jgi:hypothetical protein